MFSKFFTFLLAFIIFLNITTLSYPIPVNRKFSNLKDEDNRNLRILVARQYSPTFIRTQISFQTIIVNSPLPTAVAKPTTTTPLVIFATTTPLVTSTTSTIFTTSTESLAGPPTLVGSTSSIGPDNTISPITPTFILPATETSTEAAPTPIQQ
ncbi:23383_t:CDS:2 [Cetraspora pellucida]|uniref:23383_t:CDS:1 n=1 Tax=Cetraspora pellucida TaxID=1433469 RepID=A0A9N8WNZ5_9GLOM|nr:23383_t:CDS:2 [Cetraspora pellucida]